MEMLLITAFWRYCFWPSKLFCSPTILSNLSPLMVVPGLMMPLFRAAMISSSESWWLKEDASESESILNGLKFSRK